MTLVLNGSWVFFCRVQTPDRLQVFIHIYIYIYTCISLGCKDWKNRPRTMAGVEKSRRNGPSPCCLSFNMLFSYPHSHSTHNKKSGLSRSHEGLLNPGMGPQLGKKTYWIILFDV